MPTNLSYDVSGTQDKGSGYWYYCRKDSDGSAAASPDTYHQGFGAMEVEFVDETPEEQKYDAGGNPLGTIHGNREVTIRLKSGTDEYNIHKFIKEEVFGKYFALLVDMGWSRTDATTGRKMRKFVHVPIAKIPRTYRTTSPGGREPEIPVKAVNNLSAITFSSAAHLTSPEVSGLVALCELHATIAAASMEFVVSAGEIYDIVEIDEAV